MRSLRPAKAFRARANIVVGHNRRVLLKSGKALNTLVDAGIVYKKRGLGMFVATGAPEALRRERRAELHTHYIAPLLTEAKRLGLTPADVVDLITKDPS